ncbi:MAG: excinuclease ABC subunit UvrA [Nitrospinota bacterium]|nr:excinuclease ABC subunit UvrA [Nitrospinota bacterium]
MKKGTILIKGAREHNLKNIDLELPRDKLIVFTGISGSGKSSLAFDTIYAEGQRRYVESLSAYARQFLEQMEKPDVDLIEGLSPAISIEQKTTSKNPRSTVGTVTEIYDYLRVLFARVGTVHCYQCGRPIESQTVSQIVDSLMMLDEGSKIHVLAPIIKDRKGEYKKELANLRAKGYVRARIDGEMRGLEEDIVLKKTFKHTIEVVIDRLVVKPGIERRLADSVELALDLGEKFMSVVVGDAGKELTFSQNFACIKCGISYPVVEPRMFSFNNPNGACEKCHGLGVDKKVSEDMIVPDTSLTLAEGAVVPWASKTAIYYWNMLESLAEHYKFDANTTPFSKIPAKARKTILHGSEEETFKFKYASEGKTKYWVGKFEGVVPNLQRRYLETDSEWIRDDIEKYMRVEPCPVCNGARLRPEALGVKICGKNIIAVTALSIKEAVKYFDTLDLTAQQKHIGERVIKEIRERLGFMQNVGLEYLTLDRASATLSGGEGQRIRLATQIGSALVGVLYILDEPSIGLHQRDNDRLLETLTRLRDIGNTVIVVEHDRDTISASDHVVDIGPGAGVHGGEIVAQGTPKEVMGNKNSLTGKYLSHDLSIPVPKQRRSGTGKKLSIIGAEQNNLKKINVDIELGKFTCVTGVSGSGKSTLIIDILYKSLAREINRSGIIPGKFKSLKGVEFLDKVIDIDQSPIGRTPRSNPATYTGLFTPIRELFTMVPESRKRGYKAGRFSFNVPGGRCESCTGDGIKKIEMHFLPDVYVTCEVCKGKRFNRETLDIHYKGKNISEVLDMTIEEAMPVFGPVPTVNTKLQTLMDVGLGYIKLGQAATTLSGGEAQRVKLSRELSKRGTGSTIYILDEPTTGLHFHDIRKLLEVLNRLVDGGNTLVVIEHNLDVIKTADHIIDLGPEGGDAGGHIVAKGTPEEVAKVKGSYTGKYLSAELSSGRRT